MPGKDLLLLLTDLTDFFHGFQILCHHRKRLHRTPFQFPEPLYGLLTGGITTEMKTTDSLDGHYPAGSNGLPRISDRLPATFLSSNEIDLRPAVIAAHRLGVITSGVRIMVLIRTGRTHGKFFHAGTLPVIGKGIEDRQPRATTGTVDKRMQIPPVFRIKHLLLTFVADGNIRRNKDLTLCLLAFNDIKLRKFLRLLHRFHQKLQDGRTLRRPVLDISDKTVHILLPALGENLHIGSFIGHTATDSPCHGMTADRRAEAHTLDDSVNTDHFCNFALHMFSIPCNQLP